MNATTPPLNRNLHITPRNYPRKNKNILIEDPPDSDSPYTDPDSLRTNYPLSPTIPNPKLIILTMKNQETKTHPIIRIIKASLSDLPTPSSISYLWNVGFLLGITLTLQIITGLLISIHYTAETSYAFSSVIHLIRDVEKG